MEKFLSSVNKQWDQEKKVRMVRVDEHKTTLYEDITLTRHGSDGTLPYKQKSLTQDSEGRRQIGDPQEPVAAKQNMRKNNIDDK